MDVKSAVRDDAADRGALAEFLFRLGQAYLASGEQTATVELILRRTAAAYGMRRSRIVAFPTAIFIGLHDGVEESVSFIEGPTRVLRLDQISDVYALGEAAQRAAFLPRSGLEQLSAILRQPARFGAVGVVAGNTILAVGVAMILMPTATNLIATGLLGAIVGGLKLINRDQPVLSAPLPVVAATMVSALVFLSVKWGAPVDPLHALIPPLVAFLPGGVLTLGMVELAYGDMVSGSSRLVTGFVQLLLLAFGMAAGASLVGYLPENLVDASSTAVGGQWTRIAPWAGVVVFGVGAYLHFSGPRRSFWWMMLVSLAAFAAQQLAAAYIGKVTSGFFGMLVATPLAYLIQVRGKGPPAMVTFLPSFWLLAPGALSLLSVKYMLSGRGAGVDGMITAIFVFVSLALGTLIGAALYKLVSERLGRWQLQLARVDRYFRR